MNQTLKTKINNREVEVAYLMNLGLTDKQANNYLDLYPKEAKC